MNKRLIRSLSAAISALLILLSADRTKAVDVYSYGLSKSQSFVQTNPAAPNLISLSQQPFSFYAWVEPTELDSVYNASLRAPNGRTTTLEYNDGFFENLTNAFFESKTSLDAAWPNGTYLFTISTASGLRTPSLGLGGDVYPNAPHLNNWTAAQTINSENAFTLTWDAFIGGTTNDIIDVTIRGQNGEVFSTFGSEFGTPGALTGKSLAIALPPTTLMPGQTYEANLTFVKVLPANLTAYPGAPGIIVFSKNTALSLSTTTPQGTFQFSKPNYTVSETGVVATITVVRTNGSLGTATVDYYTEDGTAYTDFDYTGTFGNTLIFEEGVTSQTLDVPILNDSEIEGPETVQLFLDNAQGGANIGALGYATLTILDDDVPPGPNVRSYLVAKGQGFNQFSPGLPLLATNNLDELPFKFFSTVEPTFSGGVRSASLRLPNGMTNLMDDGFHFSANLATKAALDAAFTPGTYLFSIETLIEGLRSPSLTLPGDTYPPTPHLTNWAAIQAVDASGDFTVLWDPFAGGSTNDFVHLTVEDSLGEQIPSDSPGFLEKHALNGLDTAFTIPANSLAPLQTYRGRLLFVKRTALNTNSYPGVTGISGYFKETIFPLTTTEPPPLAGRFRFSAPTYRVSETGGVAAITVVRSGGSQGEATVDYATGAGTATPNADFVPAAGTLSFLDGETSKDFAVSILGDFLLEGNETVSLTLRNPIGGADVGQPTNAVLTIVDNELTNSGVLQFSATNYTVTEAGPAAIITINRTGGAVGAVTVQFSTADGTATAGLDYTNSSRTISFAANETTKTVLVPIINDSVHETNETVLLSLNNPTGGASLGPKTQAVLLIQDNDVGGKISFSAAAYSISETGLVTRIIVNRSGGAASEVTVELATSDVTATSGVDYDGVTNTLVFGVNQLSQTNLITIRDDQLPEGNETLNLTLRSPTGGATLGTISNAVLTIVDDEIALQFSSDKYTNNEAIAGAVVTIVRSGPLTSTVGVTLSTADGTATNGLDYVGMNTNLTIGVGVASRTFSIPIRNDTIVETSETILLTLSNPTGGAQLGGRTTAEVLIQDNDAGGVIQFSATNYTASEVGPAALITIVRTAGLASEVTVDLTVSDGTATAGADYTNISRTLSFAANETSKTISVPIINDTLDETNETVLLSLSNPTGGATLGPKANAVLVIQDNDTGGAISFSAAAYSVSETGLVARIIVNRLGGVASAVTVELATSDATATAGVDYDGVTNTLVFGANQLSQTNLITIRDDLLPEGSERLNLTLRSPTGGATLGAISNAVLTIVDDEITLQFSSDKYTNNEAIAGAIVTIVRSGPLTSTVGVTLSTADGTATNGLDYVGINTNLTLGVGVASRTFSIPTLNDTIVETNETILLTLSNPTGGAQLGGRTTAELLILDNDAGGVIQFSATNYTVSEAGVAALITVARTAGLASGVTVDLTINDGTATADADYTNISRTLSFAANETTKTISVPIINDTLDELDETVLLSLANPTGGASLGARTNAVLLIQDNDVAGVISFSAATYSIYETGVVARIIVNRTGGAASGVSVDFAASDGSATPDLDYTPLTTTLVFAANETSKTNLISIIDDDQIDGNKTVLLNLSNPTGRASLGTMSSAVLTIKDDEVDVRGTFNFTGSISVTGCFDSENNGSSSFTGQLLFNEQTGHDFSGRAILIFPDGETYFAQTIQGQVDAAGKLSGMYDWTGVFGVSGSGTFTGTFSGSNLQISFHGADSDESFDTCMQTGSMSGSRYLPPIGGYAPDYAQGNPVTFLISTSYGNLDYDGSFSLELSPFDNTFQIIPIAGTVDYASGFYTYTKTGLNTATIQLLDEYIGAEIVLKLTFASNHAGTYGATLINDPGSSESGRFDGSP